MAENPAEYRKTNSLIATEPDRIHRQFQAERPNHLWVSGFTYVST